MIVQLLVYKGSEDISNKYRHDISNENTNDILKILYRDEIEQMKIHDISHQLNLILNDLHIERKIVPATVELYPDQKYADIVDQQLKILQSELENPTKIIDKKIAPSEWTKIFREIDKISRAVLGLNKEKNIEKRVSVLSIQGLQYQAQITLEVANRAQQSIEEYFIQNASKAQSSSWSSWFGSLFTGSLGNFFLELVKPQAIQTFDEASRLYKSELYNLTQSTVDQEAVKNISRYIVFTLKDQILNIHERSPLLRSSFLTTFFEDITVQHPKPTATGTFIISLLQKNPQTIEKLIEANFLKGIVSLHKSLVNLQQKEPLFLVQFIHKCMEEGYTEIQESEKLEKGTGEKGHGIGIRDEFITGNFQKKITNVILELAFPNGADDLILPGGSLVSKTYRNTLWEVMQSSIGEQLRDTFRSFGQNNDLKDALLTSCLESIHSALEGQDQEISSPSAPVHHLMLNPQEGLASFGVIFIFFQVLFSTVGTTMLRIFRRSEDVVSESPYKNQTQFNDQIEAFLSYIQNESESPLIRFLLHMKGKAISEAIGPRIVEALSEINLSQIMTSQLEKLLTTVVAPEGTWMGEGENRKYVCTFMPQPKIEQDLIELDRKNEEDKKLTKERLERAKTRLGNSIEGLVDLIYDWVKLPIPEAPPVTASSIERLVKSIQKYASIVINRCMRKFISFVLFVARSQEKVREVGKIVEEKTQRLEQDTFLLTISNFASEKLHIAKN